MIRTYGPLIERPVQLAPEPPRPSRMEKLSLRLKKRWSRATKPQSSQLPPFRPKLPPELWYEIFDHLFALVCKPYDMVTTENVRSVSRSFHRCGQRILPYDEWTNVRLVSKEFYQLAGRRRYLGVTELNLREEPQGGLQAFSVRVADVAAYFAGGLGQRLGVYALVKTLDITLTPESTVSMVGIETLRIIAAEFTALRSLSIAYIGRVMANPVYEDIWAFLASEIPSLVDFSLWNYRSRFYQGYGTLSKIQSLRLSRLPATDLIRFPSLTFLWTCHWNSKGPFELLHGPRLVSLTIGRPQATLDADTLHQLPNLQHIGGPILQLAGLDVPPPNHPITHLSVVLPEKLAPGENFIEMMDALATKLTRMPTITKLSFGQSEGLTQPERDYCFTACRTTNVAIIAMERTDSRTKVSFLSTYRR